MSHLKRIEELIESFYKATSDNGTASKNMGDTKAISIELGSEIMNYVAPKDIDYVCSLLFHFEKGMIRFLRNFALSRDYDIISAQTNVLGFLTTFVTKAKSSLQMYATELEACCIQIASTGGAKARIAAMDVLMTMLNKRISRLDTSVMNISGIYTRIAPMYTSTSTKVTPTVKGKVVELLGTITRFYPAIVNEPSTLERWCLNSLDYVVFKKPKDIAIVPGVINCLNSLLFCNIRLIEPESEESGRLFRVLLELFRLPSDVTRYAGATSALELFATHTYLFKNMVLPHCEELYKYLQTCSTHQNRLLFKHGTYAYDKFLITLSEILCINPNGQREKAALQFFTEDFMEALVLGDNLEHFYRTSAAIRGIGYFSKVRAQIMKKEEIDSLCNELVKKSNWFYSDVNSEQHEYLRHLPSFLRAYSSFAGELDHVPAELMASLYCMCDIFIVSFIRMSGYHRAQGVISILNLLEMLYKKGEGVLRKFLGNFFGKALIYTCTDVEIPGKGIRHVYPDLLYFWETLLTKKRDYKPFLQMTTLQAENSVEEPEVDGENTEIESMEEKNTPSSSILLQILYDTFMSSAIQAINTFNLALKNSEEGALEEASLNIVTNTLRPVNQKDFMLFQNFVEFWCILVKKLQNERLSDWIYILGTSLIDQSVKHSLVSGFYKMIAEILVIGEKRHIFDYCQNYHSDQELRFERETRVKPDDYATYLIFREYIKEVWYRLQQFTDDLLVSCLKLVLAYPTAFFSISEITAPLEKALHIGITYNPLAVIAVNTLDKLLDPNSEHNVDDAFLSCILPCINEYLLIGVTSSNENNLSSGDLKKKSYKIPTASQRRFETMNIVTTESELGVAVSEYSPMQELQLRMMRFLGRLGGRNKQLLTKGNGPAKNDDILAWDPVKKIKIHLPFQNAKIDIYLDEFLPRICELAESSPDRRVKVAACELLHGLIIFMLGSNALQIKDTKESKESNYHEFYLRLFPIMLRLAIDPDQVPRDMFRLLNSQIIHWFTNNAHYENPETTALLKSCLQAVCNSDASLRDYGAECIQEFVKWSIKQTSRSTDGAQNIKSLLKRLYNLMSHPSSIQRFGASLVFNRIYRLFREEPTLVNEYTIELLGQLFLSLKLADSDHPSIGTKDQAIEAISHIKRIMRVKADLFLKASPIQRPFIGAEEVKDLPSVIDWAFRESAKPQRAYAKTCINFFAEFVTKIPGIESGKQWLAKKMNADVDYLIDIFETNRLNPPSVLIEEENRLDTYITWINQMQTTIDGYIWLIERDIVDHMELISQPSSMLLDAISYFIINTPQEVLEDKMEESMLEKYKILYIYHYISARVIYFFGLLFSSAERGFDCYRYINSNTSNVLLHSRFTNLVASILLSPKKISEKIEANQGHAVTNSSINRVFTIAKQFILITKERAALGLVDKIAESIAHTLLDEDISLVMSLDLNQGQMSLVNMIGTVDAIKFLQSCNLFGLVCQKAHQLDNKHPETVNEYCEALLIKYLRLCDTALEPLWIELLGEMIGIALSQPDIVAKEVKNLLGFSGIRKDFSDAAKLSILQKYGAYIFDCIAHNFTSFSTVFCSNITNPLVADYLFIILTYFKDNRISHRKALAEMTDFLIEDLSLLKKMISEWNTRDQILDLITCLKLLFGADPGIITRSRGKPVVHLLFKTFVQFFDTVDHSIIYNALDLLPVFITMEDSFLDQISESLNNSVISRFPANSSAITRGSILYNNYIPILDKLLDTMVTFKSVLIFKLLKGIIVREKHHIHEQAIRESIAKFAKNLGLFSFLEVSQSCFEQYKDSSILIMHRQNLIQLVIFLLPLVSNNHVSSFYEKNIVYIMNIISSPPLKSENTEEIIIDMKERTSCFRLMKVLYEVLPSEMVSGPVSPISVTFEKQKGKDAQGKMMTTELLKKSRAVRGEVNTSEQDDVYQARLEYNQAAYNVASAIILSTQKIPKKSEAFFDGFLFREDPNLCIWKNIFDNRKSVYLELELEQAPERMKLEKLKTNVTKSRNKKTNTMSCITSTALDGSSFTQSTLSETLLENSLKDQAVERLEEADDVTVEDMVMDDALVRDDEEIMFEMDTFNENPCMLPLREIIQKLHTEISPPEEEATKMPNWMQRLQKAFTDYDTPLIVQLYIAKIIVNYPMAFEKYASFWIEHLMKLVVQGSTYGQPMNYFVQDICIVLIAWGRHTKLPNNSESRHNLYIFLSYLTKNVYHETTRVVRSNVHILGGILKNWGQDSIIPTRLIYDEFNRTGDLSMRNIIGLQLVSIVLSNNINPYYNGLEVNLEGLTEWQFYDKLSDSLINQSKKGKYISVTAAELMGFIMKYMKESNNTLKDDLEDLFKMKFLKASKIKGREEIFISCMESFCRYDTEIGKSLFTTVVYSLPQFSGNQRVEALNVIRVYWNDDPALLSTLNSSGLMAILTYRDNKAQIAALKLLNRIFNNLKDKDISQMLDPLVEAYTEHESVECKTLYYSFLKKAFNPPRNDEKLQHRLKTHVFKGLVDSDQTISNDMFDYIESVYELESDIKKALLKIAHNMYIPDTEDIYLLYCTQMILRNSKKSYQYEKPIFENPLPNARFDANYHTIDTSWQKNLSMSPLFVQSQEKTMSAEDIELNIRATQRSIEFTQTQTLGKSLFSTFNPTQDIQNDQGQSQSSSIMEVLMIQDQKESKKEHSVKDDYYQMRFTKPKKGAVNRYHATRNEELKKRLLHLKNIKKEAQDKKVTMCRAYRVGELPDIQISYKDLLDPLEVISSSDYNVSRLLYSSLVVGIIKEDNTEDYKQQVIHYISENLYESSLFFTPTIGSFLRIFFDLNITNIESKLIKKVSSKSLNHHIGISLLEKQLIIGDTPESSLKKKRKTDTTLQISKEKEKWINLALQYKSIDEPGLFLSIYQNFVAVYDGPKKAVDYEVMGDYASAYNQFSNAKETLFDFVSGPEVHLWEEEMLHCYEKLTQWDDIAKSIDTSLSENNYYNLWQPEYQDPYLHYFIRSFTKLRHGLPDEDGGITPWSDHNPNPIFSFIEKSLGKPNEREYLLKNYACDLTLTSIYQKRYDLGGQFIRKSYESLLTAWTTLHPLAHTSHLAKLADLERIVEIEDYLSLVLDIKKNSKNLSKVPTFFKALTTRYPDQKIDSIDLWDDIIESRMLFIEDISTFASNEVLNIDKIGLQTKFLNEIVNASSAQNNFNVFSNRQNKLKNLGALKAFNLNRIRQYYCEIKRLPKDNPKRLTFMQIALSRSLSYNASQNSLTKEVYDIQINATNIFGTIKNEIIETPQLYEKIIQSNPVKNMMDAIKVKDVDQLVDYLEFTGYNRLKETLATLAEKDALYTNCLWKFGQYCDESLSAIHSSSSMIKPEINAVEYSKAVIVSYIKAMDRGHKNAAERFPRLLELIEMYPETGDTFVECSDYFGSTWLYIRWIPQLVSILDLSIAKFVYPAIRTLAKSYPKALYYPFHISCEHYELAKDKISEDNYENIEKIKHMVRSPLMEEFCLELKRLTDPEHVVKYFIEYLHSVVLNGNPSEQFIEELFENFNQLLLNPYSSKLGTIPKAFAKKHGSQLTDLMGRKGSKLKKMNKDILKKISNYVDDVISKQRAPSKTGSDLLKSYSPWLASFKSSDFDEELEVPGQYNSIAKPFPKSHAKISSIDSRVLVMSSIRKPKRIRIYGTDEKEYLFLVKGGEDLRLDQRIEQIFEVMNNMVSKNTFCLSQDIRIATYNVIPMATNLGLIEWVDNTKPLRGCIEEEVVNKGKMVRMQDKYRNWIAQKGGKGIGGYQKAFALPREEITKNLNETSAIVESTHLRDFLMRLSSSPEAFLFLRKNFAHSLAAISIYGYILGIGDRHLENFLLDLKSGRLIPIDFGHAFGSATEILPIPELVPFRLTPQLIGALEPLGISGILEIAMTNILEAIQNEKDLLLNIMDIFVKEPLLDWKKAAVKQTKNQDIEHSSTSSHLQSSASSTDEIKWYPQQKVDLARKKLEGVNPADIFIELLKNGHGKQKYFENACNIVRGEKTAIRAKSLGKNCKDSKEQVKCLIDLATDPAVLGLMWIGWQSYL